MTHIRRKSALGRIQCALASSLAEDYDVVVEERRDIRGNWSGWLVGKCKAGHEFEMATDKWHKSQRCAPCRHDEMVARWMQVAAEAGYNVAAQVRDSPRGGQETIFVGTCSQGHPVEGHPSRMFNGGECVPCARSRAENSWLELAEKEGYRVTCSREAQGTRHTAYLNGTCGAEHPFRMRAKHFVAGQRCKECNRRAAVECHAVAARTEGYDVTIEFGHKGALLVGHCSRGHSLAMRTDTFKAGGRCGECRLEDLRDEHLAVARSEGYEVALEFRDNGTQNVTWFVGRCPEGHDFDMPMTRFAKGRRCHMTFKSGFDPSKSAHLYVVEGRGLVKFGIANSLSTRLASHAKNGFTEWRIFISSEDGALIQNIESKLKRWVPDNGGDTCHSKGMRFDGATESFVLSDLDWRWFDQLLADALELLDAQDRCEWWAPDTGIFPATRSLGVPWIQS